METWLYVYGKRFKQHPFFSVSKTTPYNNSIVYADDMWMWDFLWGDNLIWWKGLDNFSWIKYLFLFVCTNVFFLFLFSLLSLSLLYTIMTCILCCGILIFVLSCARISSFNSNKARIFIFKILLLPSPSSIRNLSLYRISSLNVYDMAFVRKGRLEMVPTLIEQEWNTPLLKDILVQIKLITKIFINMFTADDIKFE